MKIIPCREAQSRQDHEMLSAQRGEFYWCAHLPSGRIYFYADEIKTDGDMFYAYFNDQLAISARYLLLHSASVIDGAAIAVVHWDENNDI